MWDETDSSVWRGVSFCLCLQIWKSNQELRRMHLMVPTKYFDKALVLKARRREWCAVGGRGMISASAREKGTIPRSKRNSLSVILSERPLSFLLPDLGLPVP